MFGVDGITGGGERANTVAVDVHIEHQRPFGRDVGGDLQLEVGLAKLDGCEGAAPAGGGRLVRQLGALLDQGLGLVGSDHPRARDHLAPALRLQRRQLQIDEAVGRGTEQGHRHTGGRHQRLSGRTGRQGHLVAADRPRTGGGVGRAQLPERCGLAVERHRARRPHAQAHAQRLPELVVGLDDPRLDQHLPHRHIEPRHHLLQLGQPRRHVAQKELVGARLGHDAATRAQPTPGRQAGTAACRIGALQAEGHLAGPCVLQAQGQHLQRADAFERGLGLQPFLFTLEPLVLGGHPHHLALLPGGQALGLQDHLQRLRPGQVVQTHRDLSTDPFGGDEVEPGEVGEDLHQRTHFGVLKIQADRRAVGPRLQAGRARHLGPGHAAARGHADDRLLPRAAAGHHGPPVQVKVSTASRPVAPGACNSTPVAQMRRTR